MPSASICCPSALRACGAPIDQFSFKESADGHLNVLLSAGGGGDAMWAPELGYGDLGLLRAPLSAFSAVAGSTAATAATGSP